MGKAEDGLREAFAGESQANRRYLAYARKADEEGYAQVARMFRAAAAAETVHAHSHLRALGAVGTTEQNLKDAVDGETHEFKNMYPAMIEDAKAEGNADAQRSFHYANEVEKIHAELYQGLLDNLGKQQKEFSYYVCPVCGFTAEEHAPDKCPICATPGDKFEEIE
ncbi:MAG: rubrerythrin family protein [bacterium]|jgi:rubrerythrin